jgi:hypothetical protein
MVPVIETSFNVHPESRFETNAHIEFDFNATGFQSSLNEIRNFVDIICFKYVVSQPVIAAIMFADDLIMSQEDLIFKKFDEAILACQEFTSSLHVGIAKVKMSVTGIILWCFLDPTKAKSFDTNLKGKLKKWHFWRKVMTLSWCVDLQKNSLSKHSGPPIILQSVFDTQAFVRYLSVTV